jgi:hypothetical protein
LSLSKKGSPLLSDLVLALLIGVVLGIIGGIWLPAGLPRTTSDYAEAPTEREQAPSCDIEEESENEGITEGNDLYWEAFLKKMAVFLSGDMFDKTIFALKQTPDIGQVFNSPALYLSTYPLSPLGDSKSPALTGSTSSEISSDENSRNRGDRNMSEKDNSARGRSHEGETSMATYTSNEASLAITLIEEAILNGNPIPLLAQLDRPSVRSTLLDMARSSSVEKMLLPELSKPKVTRLLTEILESKPLQDRAALLLDAPQVRSLIDLISRIPGAEEAFDRLLEANPLMNQVLERVEKVAPITPTESANVATTPLTLS